MIFLSFRVYNIFNTLTLALENWRILKEFRLSDGDIIQENCELGMPD